MKTLIYFNGLDCPENIGKSQLVDSVEQFLIDRKNILIDAEIVGNKIIFTKAVSQDNEIIKGYALFFEVPGDFNN